MPPVAFAYDELKLRIERGEAGAHRVIATSPVGEATGVFVLPFSDMEVENFVLRVSRPRGRRRIDSSAMGDAQRFGGLLFDAMFQQQVRDLYQSALANARGDGRGLRVTLCLSGAPELMDVPWEYLYDRPSFLAVSAFTPVVRYLDLPRGHRPLTIEPPMRILAMVSSPIDYERLDVERERANLERALEGLIASRAVEVHWLEQPTLSALLRTLQSDTFHVLHYVGHGSYDPQAEQGVLLLQDENGYGRAMSGDKLGMVLHDFTSLRLAVLNACEGARTSRNDPFAGVAASLVERDIPAVIAMQFEITDAAAVVFAEGFYRALASGSPVDASLAAARLAIFAEFSDDIEWGIPVLFMRVADGRIFDVPKAVARPGEPVAPPVDRAAPAQALPPAAQPGAAAARQRAADSVAPSAERTLQTHDPGRLGRAERPGAGTRAATTRRPGAHWAAVVAAVVAAIVVGVVIANHGSGTQPQPTLSPTVVPTVSTTSPPPATRPTRIRGRWTGALSPLRLTVTQIDNEDGHVTLHVRARNDDPSSTIKLSLGESVTAQDDRQNIYHAEEDYTFHDVAAGTSIPLVFPLTGTMSSRARSLTVSFTNLYGTFSLSNRSITIRHIPVPQ